MPEPPPCVTLRSTIGRDALGRDDSLRPIPRPVTTALPSPTSHSTVPPHHVDQVTPTIELTQGKAITDLTLDDVWSFYSEPSLYGREVYTLGGVRGPSLCYFVPYLSAMQLFTLESPKKGSRDSRYEGELHLESGRHEHEHMYGSGLKIFNILSSHTLDSESYYSADTYFHNFCQ